MSHGRTRATVIDLVSWAIVALVGLVTLTQAIGRSGTLLAVVQPLTPYFAIALIPVVLVALVRRQLLIMTVAAAIGFGIGVLAAPLAFPEAQPIPAVNATRLRVASLNLWYENPEISTVTDILPDVDADVIVFIEYTLEHQTALESSPLARDYPYRTEPTGSGRDGVGIWSRFPIDDEGQLSDLHDSTVIDVRRPGGQIRIVGIHVPNPISNVAAWRSDLRDVASVGRNADRPTLLIGDLNSSYWHPPFRRLLDAGFVDAHVAIGSGFSTSWPTDWRIPPFVQLDHALTTGGLVATDVENFDIPGSDHLGLVVTVAPAR